MCGQIACDWNTIPSPRCSGGTSRPGATTGSPLMWMVPLSGCSSPAIMRSVVVFPQPEGPSRVKISASWISRSMPLTTLFAAAPLP